MNSFRFSAALAACLALAACKEAPAPSGAAASRKAEPVSIAAIEAQARGITVGSAMSTRTVFVFFDPQCPHCAALWQAAKPLKSQAKFVWIPVRLMNDSSLAQGATLLAAKDPVAAMDEHEASVLEKRGGITAIATTEAQKQDVSNNTALMTRFGFASIPSIVAQHAQTGALVTHEGALATPELAGLLGLKMPAGS
jgi:thiol:disulfide interchange protein DsbG